MKAFSDQKLVALVQATGDGDAFSELAGRHIPALKAFLHSVGGHEAGIDDAVQQSLILAYSKLEQFRSSSSFRTWLFRIAFREHARLARKDASRKSRREAYNEKAPMPFPQDPDLSIDMEKALAQLSDLERSSVILCDAYGLSHGDVAEMLEAPLGSVKTYVRRAREKMLAFLTGSEKEI